MLHNIPSDLKAEVLLDYIPKEKRDIELKGSHKRNAYQDISSISENGSTLTVALSKNGMYDILPETMFHPVDRFDSIRANEYKERFKEECEQQQKEEENARKYFQPFDRCIVELGVLVADCKIDLRYQDVLKDIICDRMPKRYEQNRFIKRAIEYLPICSRIRGNKSLFTLMLRNILFEEGIMISNRLKPTLIRDENPRYCHRLRSADAEESPTFLGNEFEEDIQEYNITIWKEEECNESFMTFVSEMKEFEAFLTDFFLGIGDQLKFDISTDTLPVRLADEVYFSYLDYNTNL